MGSILDVKKQGNGKVKYSLVLDKEEMLALGGNLTQINLLPLKQYSNSAEVIETGIYNSTKYFKIPQEMSLRNSRGKRCNVQRDISCQHYSIKDKEWYIYVIQK